MPRNDIFVRALGTYFEKLFSSQPRGHQVIKLISSNLSKPEKECLGFVRDLRKYQLYN